MLRSSRWVFLAAMLPVAACSNSSSTPMTSAPTPPPPAYSQTDMMFINAAAGTDAAEIQDAQLAQQKARSPRVKAFAAKMIEDHTKTTQQLTSIVQAKGVTPQPMIPQPAQENYAKLQADTPRSFDRDYDRGQVEGHMMAVKTFQDEIANGNDPDLKKFAQATLPIIQQHLRMARRLAGAHA